jgi:uncharacterized phage protein (predicted DNA packaging)
MDELKQFLRIDGDDEDKTLEGIEKTAEALARSITRTDGRESKDIFRMAVLYACAYLYEHREEADYDTLTRMLRCILSPVRKEVF